MHVVKNKMHSLNALDCEAVRTNMEVMEMHSWREALGALVVSRLSLQIL